MKKNRNELHETRLATTDETGARIFLHPENVKGKWQDRKKYVYWFLIFIYLVLPWIYINGEQWILLDISQRKFHVFGFLFYAHDIPLLFYMAIIFSLVIAFITSVWGRVWCGWACPQTVFIDAIFRKIEIFVEGNSRKRRELDEAPMNFNKILKRTIKWTLYLIVSLHIVHSFLGYFVGTKELLNYSFSAPSENWTLFVTMLGLTALILLDFGWFREQFCIIACPYGRFQSVLMDESSLVIGYDSKRGEPRRNIGVVDKKDEGDCINCYHCVKVCPTGIDIRRGSQLECIACTNCMDACDEIMTKLSRPTGLIKYTTENKLEHKPEKKTLRPYIYLALILFVSSLFIFNLASREILQTTVLRGSQMAYQLIDEANVSNHFKIKISSPLKEAIELKVVAEEKDGFTMVMAENPVEIETGINEISLFVTFEKERFFESSKSIQIELINDKYSIEQELELKLVGPLH